MATATRNLIMSLSRNLLHHHVMGTSLAQNTVVCNLKNILNQATRMDIVRHLLH